MTDVASTRAAVAEDAVGAPPERFARHTLVWLSIFFALGLTIALALQLAGFAPEDKGLEASMVAQLLNAHALLLVFFCGLPALTHVFGQAVLPLAVGRRDHAFPLLAQWGHRLHAVGGIIAVLAIALGAVPARWSLVGTRAVTDGAAGTLLALGLHLMALSLVATALNHLTTLFAGSQDDDAPTPVFAWTFGVVAVVALAVAPAMASWSVLFLVQGTGTELFGAGGTYSMATLARLFGYVASGAQLLVVVAGIGLGLQILADAAVRPLDLGSRVGPALGALALLGLFAGAYPMGEGADAAVVASALRFAMAIPAAVLIQALWTVARNGLARVDASVLHTLAFVVHATVLAASGLALASLATGPVLAETKFQIAHQHLAFVGCGLTIFFAASHRWWPAVYGTALDERFGAWGAGLVFAGTQMAFLPSLVTGARGVLVGDAELPADLGSMGVLVAFGAVVLTVGVLLEGWAMLQSVIEFQKRNSTEGDTA